MAATQKIQMSLYPEWFFFQYHSLGLCVKTKTCACTIISTKLMQTSCTSETLTVRKKMCSQQNHIVLLIQQFLSLSNICLKEKKKQPSF